MKKGITKKIGCVLLAVILSICASSVPTFAEEEMTHLNISEMMNRNDWKIKTSDAGDDQQAVTMDNEIMIMNKPLPYMGYTAKEYTNVALAFDVKIEYKEGLPAYDDWGLIVSLRDSNTDVGPWDVKKEKAYNIQICQSKLVLMKAVKGNQITLVHRGLDSIGDGGYHSFNFSAQNTDEGVRLKVYLDGIRLIDYVDASQPILEEGRIGILGSDKTTYTEIKTGSTNYIDDIYEEPEVTQLYLEEMLTRKAWNVTSGAAQTNLDGLMKIENGEAKLIGKQEDNTYATYRPVWGYNTAVTFGAKLTGLDGVEDGEWCSVVTMRDLGRNRNLSDPLKWRSYAMVLYKNKIELVKVREGHVQPLYTIPYNTDENKHSYTFATADTKDGVRILLAVDGVSLGGYLDDDAPITEQGGIGVYCNKGLESLTLSSGNRIADMGAFLDSYDVSEPSASNPENYLLTDGELSLEVSAQGILKVVKITGKAIVDNPDEKATAYTLGYSEEESMWNATSWTTYSGNYDSVSISPDHTAAVLKAENAGGTGCDITTTLRLNQGKLTIDSQIDNQGSGTLVQLIPVKLGGLLDRANAILYSPRGTGEKIENPFLNILTTGKTVYDCQYPSPMSMQMMTYSVAGMSVGVMCKDQTMEYKKFLVGAMDKSINVEQYPFVEPKQEKQLYQTVY